MPAQEFQVQIFKNDASQQRGIPLIVAKGTSMAKFKKLAAKRLGLRTAKHVFLLSGTEVLHMDEVSVDDQLFISQGEPFFKSLGSATGGMNAQETLHVSVLGHGGVGKSAITLRFVRDFFVQDWDPTIEDAYRKAVDVDDRLCTLEILDTAGQDDFESLRPQWMMDKDGYVFVYSMDSRKSLEELKPFFELHRQINSLRQVPLILVANKSDIVAHDPSKRQVSREMGMSRAQHMGAIYMETSAFTGDNVHEVFETFIREVRRVKKPESKNSGFLRKCTIL